MRISWFLTWSQPLFINSFSLWKSWSCSASFTAFQSLSEEYHWVVLRNYSLKFWCFSRKISLKLFWYIVLQKGNIWSACTQCVNPNGAMEISTDISFDLPNCILPSDKTSNLGISLQSFYTFSLFTEILLHKNLNCWDMKWLICRSMLWWYWLQALSSYFQTDQTLAGSNFWKRILNNSLPSPFH